MHKTKKFLLPIGMVALAFALTACGSGTPNVNDNMDILNDEETSITPTNSDITADSGDKKLDLGEFNAQPNPATSGAVLDKEMEEALSSKVQAPGKQSDLVSKYSRALIKTNQGDITVKFYNEESPVTVNNFLYLAQAGFYNGSKFHRVIKDFMIQGGDPNSKDNDWSNDGFGGPGYQFQDEINNHKLVAGSLAMANSGPGTNGSQFFIVTADSTPWLDGAHTNFGQVVEGLEIIRKIEATEVNGNDHPTSDMTIISIELLK